METTPAGSAPVPAPTAEPKVVTPAAAQPPASSLPVSEAIKGLEGARTRKELQEFTDKLLSEAVANKPATPPAETPAPAPAEAPAPAPAVDPAAAPAADPATPAAPAKEADPEAPVDPEAPETAAPAAPAVDPEEPVSGEEPDDVTPAAPGRHRLAINKDDEVGLMASAFKRRNKDWTMKQCVEAAEAKLGVAQPAKPATDPAAPATPQLPATVEATQSEILKLVALKKEAATGLRVDEMADIDEKIAALREHKLDLREAQVQQRQKADIDYQSAYEASDRLAAETYRFASVPTSPAGKRMVEIEEAMERTGDPRFHDPNKPMLIANMVAAEFKIAPLSKTKAPAKAPAKAATPAGDPPKKGILPSGGSSTAPAAPAVNAVEKRIAAISTQAELRNELKGFGIQI